MDRRKSLTDKIIIYSGIGVAILAVIVIGLLMYSKKLSDDVKDSTMSLEDMASITSNNIANTESASTQMGKNVEEAKNEIAGSTNTANNTTNNVNKNSTTNTVNTNNSANTTNNVKTQNNSNTSNASSNKTTNDNKQTNQQVNKVEQSKKEWNFAKPVEGEVVREYAKDNLIYSETLKEWITHMGIDIKADKTTVVKSAEEGTIKSIKNDPRYGLTIVIEHDKNYQTVYSNLLTSEFVVEGEKVEKGQAIGTVGNTAVFEIADEPHLHFEILKDSIPQDPNIYIK